MRKLSEKFLLVSGFIEVKNSQNLFYVFSEFLELMSKQQTRNHHFRCLQAPLATQTKN